MKMRPQFNLRFHNVEEFEAVMDAASALNESMNETVLLKMRSGFGWEDFKGNATGIERLRERVAKLSVGDPAGKKGVNNGVDGETGNNSGVEQRGISSGVAKSDVGEVQPRGLHSPTGRGGGKVTGTEKGERASAQTSRRIEAKADAETEIVGRRSYRAANQRKRVILSPLPDHGVRET
jgi:hypothetical protein